MNEYLRTDGACFFLLLRPGWSTTGLLLLLDVIVLLTFYQKSDNQLLRLYYRSSWEFGYQANSPKWIVSLPDISGPDVSRDIKFHQ